MPSVTQENIRNITIQHGELEKLLEYVAQNGLNDILQYQIAETLEELENEESEIALFARVAARLESIGWQPTQVRKAIEILAKVTRKQHKKLRTVTVGYNPPFLSGLQTVSRVLEMGTGKLLQAWVFTNGQADASITLYDSPDITDTPNSSFLLRILCSGADLVNSDSFKEELGFTALTAILTGQGASYSVLYRTLERGTGEQK
ncbi:hypothetical protein ES702_01992 [subsurface metagenome]